MRFLAYILIIAAAVGFFAWRQNSAPVSPISPLPPFSSPSPTEISDTPPAPEKTAETPPKTKTPQPTPAKSSADQKTLDLIQQKIADTAEELKHLTPVSTLPPLSPLTPLSRLSQQELYAKAASRVVNFFCQQGSNVRVASGVIISPQGHLLTNAHVAEGFDGEYECIIRQGSPARNLAYAKIVMFPLAYSAATTRQAQAENDISIWKMTRLANGDPIAEPWPYYDINTQYYPADNQIMATFSYPSELLGYETLLKNLNMLFAETTVMDFDRDLVISGAGLSSQVGSSGGILVDIYTNQFGGLIFAVSKDEQINQRKLFSLTPYSVERVVQAETNTSLNLFLQGQTLEDR